MCTVGREVRTVQSILKQKHFWRNIGYLLMEGNGTVRPDSELTDT